MQLGFVMRSIARFETLSLSGNQPFVAGVHRPVQFRSGYGCPSDGLPQEVVMPIWSSRRANRVDAVSLASDGASGYGGSECRDNSNRRMARVTCMLAKHQRFGSPTHPAVRDHRGPSMAAPATLRLPEKARVLLHSSVLLPFFDASGVGMIII